ncbi:SoxR reducing system RseC family protein [Rivihabitans pingtungensis]|uniref:SoxR reducing system RseC family protein n=1 Tax=Rivihabitans pingtungensis TaxID=1054498 RepID=UPI002353D2C6|nr:SoxR reducing system RseC family protein [Rivihabitans pingtungensis]MCK6437977.1 SoxR reducing system RseC family protein [Rivihabitans pingtungensis]
MSQSYSQHTVEGIARVVRVDGQQLWLEPEQTTSCGHCASSASCSAHSQEAAGMGTVASRLQARRFMITAPAADAYHEGERLVVGIGEQALLRAALTAYGLPLAGALLGGALCQGLYGEDLISMLGMAGGLAAGLLAARLRAGRLAARGELSPRVLRRARPDETCATV